MLLMVIFISGIWALSAVGLATAQAGHITTRIHDLGRRLSIFSPRALGQPTTLNVHDLTIIRRDAQHVDVVGFLKNTNADWGAAKVQYTFVLGSTSTSTQTTWVNPGEDRPVMVQNIALAADVQPTLSAVVAEWSRSTSRTPLPSFTIETPTWSGTQVPIRGASIDTIAVQAAVRNESVYNYYQVRVPIIVRSSQGIVAVEELVIDRWKSRETKKIGTSWTYPISSVSTVEVKPSVSAFDASNRF